MITKEFVFYLWFSIEMNGVDLKMKQIANRNIVILDERQFYL